MISTTHLCECTDRECPNHKGKSGCANEGTVLLERTDYAGRPNGYYCNECAEDMLMSGYFAYPNGDEFPQDLCEV